VHVPAWLPDGTARVSYRGAAWQVRLAAGKPALGGEHVIVALHGSELVLAPLAGPQRP